MVVEVTAEFARRDGSDGKWRWRRRQGKRECVKKRTPPAPLPEPPLLFRPYTSSQKGGTLIAEGVEDVEVHEALVASGGYRPERCPTCGYRRPHLHEYRTRRSQRGAQPRTKVLRVRCAAKDCRALWQILPSFVARWLHYNWDLVEAHTRGAPPSRRRGRPPSKATVRRWQRRVGSSAARLARLLADTGGRLAALSRSALANTRLALVDALSMSFADVASWLHRLMPGVRLM